MSTVTTQTAAPPKRMTADDLLAMPDSGKGYELVDGRLVEKAMGSKSSAVNRRVSKHVGIFVDEHGLGEVYDSEGGYQCFPHDPNRVRKPDVSFVRQERLPGGESPDGWSRLPPDLAVEVISPKDRVQKLNEKLADYRSVAVPLVWIVDQKTRTVVVQTAGESTQRLLQESDLLDGGDVLPGFSVRVAELFPPPREAKQ